MSDGRCSPPVVLLCCSGKYRLSLARIKAICRLPARSIYLPFEDTELLAKREHLGPEPSFWGSADKDGIEQNTE